METAVVLAGGKSLRLLPVTMEIPKVLVEIDGQPILYWLVKWLKAYGVKHLVMAVAYKKEVVEKYVKDNNSFDIKVDFSEDPGVGPMYGYKLAIERFVKDENFIAMNADEFTNMDLNRMIKMHMERKPIATMGVSPFTPRFGIIKIDGNDLVEGFEYGKRVANMPVHMGVDIFNKKIVDYISGPGASEDMVYGKLVKDKALIAYVLSDGEEWLTVNTVKDVDEVSVAMRKWKRI